MSSSFIGVLQSFYLFFSDTPRGHYKSRRLARRSASLSWIIAGICSRMPPFAHFRGQDAERAGARTWACIRRSRVRDTRRAGQERGLGARSSTPRRKQHTTSLLQVSPTAQPASHRHPASSLRILSALSYNASLRATVSATHHGQAHSAEDHFRSHEYLKNVTTVPGSGHAARELDRRGGGLGGRGGGLGAGRGPRGLIRMYS
ncbi:hypothetical protein GGX14DRAFT_572863 [Mycena pura]|uniref:Uncharacterized protein n=1 Tax=Mycena pura TaxID=153505 RepID=A0AAD6V7T6_9AGAR|nr:hypothetical protein GGX14DRAFT_572863 [Mycena pura]